MKQNWNFLSLIGSERKSAATFTLFFFLTLSPPRRSHAENSADAKFLYYQEDKNRIRVLAPTFMSQYETESGWTIKLDGIYNSITGATPTGAPPSRNVTSLPTTTRYEPQPQSTPAPTVTPVTTTPQPRNDGENEHDSYTTRSRGTQSLSNTRFSAVTGATPAVTPPPTSTPPATSSGSTGSAPSSGSTGAAPSSQSTPSSQQAAAPAPKSGVPLADFSDNRWGFNLGLSKRMGQHTPGGQFSFSQESDYQSAGISLQDAIDFNKKNTTLLVGGALTHDTLSPSNGRPSETKDSIDAILGITQVLSPTTLLTANIEVGQVSGFISDPYKVVELNNTLTYEKRPESKTKEIIYIGIDQFITPLNGSIEVGLRHYGDSFGINSETISLAWFQKVGDHFIVSPSARYYTQTAADFYDIRFTGSPEFYSSDYRLSAFKATSFGLKFIWLPSARLTMDVGVERYQQSGSDGKTDTDMYPAATLFIIGAHWAL